MTTAGHADSRAMSGHLAMDRHAMGAEGNRDVPLADKEAYEWASEFASG